MYLPFLCRAIIHARVSLFIQADEDDDVAAACACVCELPVSMVTSAERREISENAAFKRSMSASKFSARAFIYESVIVSLQPSFEARKG